MRRFSNARFVLTKGVQVQHYIVVRNTGVKGELALDPLSGRVAIGINRTDDGRDDLLFSSCRLLRFASRIEVGVDDFAQIPR